MNPVGSLYLNKLQHVQQILNSSAANAMLKPASFSEFLIKEAPQQTASRPVSSKAQPYDALIKRAAAANNLDPNSRIKLP